MAIIIEERVRRKKLMKAKSQKAVSRSKRLVEGSRERIARAKQRKAQQVKKAS